MGLDPLTISWIIVGISTAVSVGVGIMGAQAAKKARKMSSAAADRARGTTHQIRASAAPRRLIFGTQRVGAIEAYLASGGPDNENLHYIFIWGDGPCQSLKAFLLDGIEVELETLPGGFAKVPVASSPYAGYIRIETNLGKLDGSEPVHGQGIIPGWGPNDRLEGICYSWVEFRYHEDVWPHGLPEASAIIEGIANIRDPRLEPDTNGEQVAWTDNPALCLNYYLTLLKRGPGLPDSEVGQEEMLDAANACDALNCDAERLSEVAETKTYTFNGVVTLTDDTEEIINQFLTAMAGWRVYVGGQFCMYAGAPQGASFIITDRMLVGPVSKKYNTSRLDRFNVVRGVYVSDKTNWQPTDFPAYKNAQLLAADNGEELIEDVDLIHTNDALMARRLAKVFCMRSRLDAVTVPCSIEAYRAQAGLAVYLHSPRNGFDMVFMDVVAVDLICEKLEMRVVLQLVGIAGQEDATLGGVCDPSNTADLPDLGGRLGAEEIYTCPGDESGTSGSTEFDVPPVPPVVPPLATPTGGKGTSTVEGGTNYTDLLTRGSAAGIPETTGAIPASAECRNKGGEGCLCGYAEFGAPSDPPRFYRHLHRSSGISPFQVCSIGYNGCAVPPLTYPPNFVRTFYGNVPGIAFNVGQGCGVFLQSVNEATGMSSYKVYSCATVDDAGTPTPGPPTVVPSRVENQATWTQGGVSHNVFSPTAAAAQEATIQIPTHGGDVNFVFSFHYVSWQSRVQGWISPGYKMMQVVEDTWNLVGDFGAAPACSLAQTDTSSRSTFQRTQCAKPVVEGDTLPYGSDPVPQEPGAPVVGSIPPSSGPAGLYGAGVSVEVTNPLQQVFTGVGCIGPSGVKTLYDGQITDTLSIEDTIEVAVANSLGHASILDVPTGELDPLATTEPHGTSCLATILRLPPENRCFVFREVKTRGYVAPHWITLAHNYRVTLYYGRRPAGSGTFALFAQDEFEITALATHVTHGIYTDWFAIPNADGYETTVIGAMAEDITVP